MFKEREIWTPENSKTIWRIAGLSLLYTLWLRDQGSEIGIVLLLFLANMALIRWRFSLPGWIVLIDLIVCLAIIPLWPNGIYALAIPVFEAMLVGRSWIAMIILIFYIIYPHSSLALVTVLLQAGFFGWTIGRWSRETELYRQEADQQRRYRYELEELRSELFAANIQGVRMAELTERNRIAQELHDSVGHEITAAVLAFQAFDQLWREGDPMAGDMFKQGRERLSKSALQLRETVHNMRPMAATGVDCLVEIINGFAHCPIDLKIYGDTSKVPAYLWTILESSLKEALTNVIRHAQATKVAVLLDVNPHIVRLSVLNDGDSKGSDGLGIGLRNLRQRAKAVGGSVSVDDTDGFRLICVLPIEGDK